MPWKITNTVLDPSKAMLQRRAPRMTTEPLIAGKILRLRETLVISDEAYEANKGHIEHCVQQGVISAEQVGGEKKAPAPAEKKPEPEAEPLPEALPPTPPVAAEPPSEPDPKKPTAPKKGKKRRGH